MAFFAFSSVEYWAITLTEISEILAIVSLVATMQLSFVMHNEKLSYGKSIFQF